MKKKRLPVKNLQDELDRLSEVQEIVQIAECEQLEDILFVFQFILITLALITNNGRL